MGSTTTPDPTGAARPKVFGIGLARTGTTSLHRAWLALGLRSAPSSAPLLDDLDHPMLGDFDAFADNPIPFRFVELDDRFPGARFVHTHRPLEPWLASMAWLFGPGLDRLDPPTRRLGDRVHRELYGIERYDEAVLTRIWHDHHDAVTEHFAGRTDDVLQVATDALDWEPMCGFLGLTPPATPFPHSNAAAADPARRRVVDRLRRRGR